MMRAFDGQLGVHKKERRRVVWTSFSSLPRQRAVGAAVMRRRRRQRPTRAGGRRCGSGAAVCNGECREATRERHEIGRRCDCARGGAVRRLTMRSGRLAAEIIGDNFRVCAAMWRHASARIVGAQYDARRFVELRQSILIAAANIFCKRAAYARHLARARLAQQPEKRTNTAAAVCSTSRQTTAARACAARLQPKMRTFGDL